MMTEKVLGHKSPLYGRRTAQMKIEAMSFFFSTKFFKRFSAQDLVRIYALVGGMPGYLLEFDDKKSLRENIKDLFLSKELYLFMDAEFVLREELREPKFYFSILRAIALGKTKLSEIINETGLEKGVVSKYLSVLSDLDFVARKVPITERFPHKSRKGIYVLKDNYYQFWFRFIYPNVEFVEEGRSAELLSSIMKNLDQYVSFIFEDICRQWVKKNKGFARVGSWWHNEEEIDIVGVSSDSLLLAECKYKEQAEGDALLKDLRVKATQFSRKKEFLIFALSFQKKGEQFVDLRRMLSIAV
jgi:hypothetical protein